MFSILYPRQRAKRLPPRHVARLQKVQSQEARMGTKKESKSKPGTDKGKKKIIIFSSIGGGGHAAVSKGLSKYLCDSYDVKVINAFQEVFGSIDSIGTITFGRVYGEDFYNFCLRCRWTNFIGRFARTGMWYYRWRNDELEKLAIEYFKKQKPDLVISVIPMINGGLFGACQKEDIPFLIVTNDLDTGNYVNGLSKPDYKKFHYTLAFEDESLREKIQQAQIPQEQVSITGFPLRPEFFTKKDVPALKKEFKIPEGKPVVMVFMGGAGSLASYPYVRNLAKMKTPMHIIACLGRNERLKMNIKKIALPEGVTISVLGFTDRIADLMAISDVLITKPGPGSVCEGLESCVPMILDLTGGAIYWENLNVDFIVGHEFGEGLTDFKQLGIVLKKYLNDTAFTSSLKNKMRQFKRKRFDKKIKKIIERMLAQ
jgi:UDP-N-acetylglucosamine:LPS N-acetylglucosamine transferase